MFRRILLFVGLSAVAITAAGPWVLTDLSERKVPPPDRVTFVAGGDPDAG